MGSHYTKFTPGFKPDDSFAPQKEENYKSILEAYEKAVNFINEDGCRKRSYCTIGPNNWVIFWRKEEEETTLRVKFDDNVILCYHDDLEIKFPKGVDSYKITAERKD